MIKQIASWLSTETAEDKEKTKIIVDQIHKEFNTAGEQLAIEAKSLLATLSEKEIKKAERLERLGFVESVTVKGNRENVHLRNLAQKHIKAIERYSVEYPNYKFITEDQVEAICKKYNLICGDVQAYKGFVPEKNLAEMEAFGSVKTADWQGRSIYVTNMTYDTYKDWKPVVNDFLSRRVKVSSPDEWEVGRLLAEHKKIYFPKLKTKWDHISPNELEYVECATSHDLLICAPKKDMNVKGKTKVGFQWLEKKRVTFPDPVVLKPIKGGYLILTAWGDEASDELVVNHKLN